MKSILHELYYGKISPWEKPYKYDSEQRKIIGNLDNKEKELLALLNEQEKVLFEEICNMQSRLHGFSAADNFVEGFCLGVRIILEVIER